MFSLLVPPTVSFSLKTCGLMPPPPPFYELYFILFPRFIFSFFTEETISYQLEVQWYEVWLYREGGGQGVQQWIPQTIIFFIIFATCWCSKIIIFMVWNTTTTLGYIYGIRKKRLWQCSILIQIILHIIETDILHIIETDTWIS